MRLEELQNNIKSEVGILLYFSGENCSVCHALRPKFQEVFDTHFPLVKQIYIDAHENPEISAQLINSHLFSTNCLIIIDIPSMTSTGSNPLTTTGLLYLVGKISYILLPAITLT